MSDNARPSCASEWCNRETNLDPPYCCVPCAVATQSPGVPRLHSTTCERRFLPDLPDDWRVLWCPGCCYAVIWDKSVEPAEDEERESWLALIRDAAWHECPADKGSL